MSISSIGLDLAGPHECGERGGVAPGVFVMLPRLFLRCAEPGSAVAIAVAAPVLLHVPYCIWEASE